MFEWRETESGFEILVDGAWVPLDSLDAATVNAFEASLNGGQPTTGQATTPQGEEDPGPRPPGHFGPWPPTRLESEEEAIARAAEEGTLKYESAFDNAGKPTQGDPITPALRRIIDWDAVSTANDKARKQAAEEVEHARQEEERRVKRDEAIAGPPPKNYRGPWPLYDRSGNLDFNAMRQADEEAAIADMDVPEFPSEERALAWGRQKGLHSPVAEFNGRAWTVTEADPVAGKRYMTADAAQRDAPPGFRPVSKLLNDGSTIWTLERMPETQEQRIESWDDLILRTAIEKGRDAALEIDRFRDIIESPSQQISPLDAFAFAARFADDAATFKEIAELVMGFNQSNTFARDLQAATGLFAQAQQPTTQQQLGQALGPAAMEAQAADPNRLFQEQIVEPQRQQDDLASLMEQGFTQGGSEDLAAILAQNRADAAPPEPTDLEKFTTHLGLTGFDASDPEAVQRLFQHPNRERLSQRQVELTLGAEPSGQITDPAEIERINAEIQAQSRREEAAREPVAAGQTQGTSLEELGAALTRKPEKPPVLRRVRTV
jgi:hypothetical protein